LPPWALSAVLAFAIFSLPNCEGYSVLTHETIVDAAWENDIVPLLLRRFPNSTPEEQHDAHAFAYGGAIIQDLGYYPLGNKFFSDLTHYVRSGDFVLALIEESQNLNEYAFALGALSHYAADNAGHEMATNHAVPLMYPKLGKKYGPVVTYQQSPSAHAEVEFGFDVDQVAKGHYAPKAYRDFVGFEVAKPVLERAFAKTYSLEVSTIFVRVDRTIGSYRHAAATVIPRMTKVAWHLKKDEIQHSDPSETKSKFTYNISNSAYRNEWGDVYEKRDFFSRCKALIIRIVPKVGPFSTLKFHAPTPEVEQLYMKSVNESLDHYRVLLADLAENKLRLPNDNLDTGAETAAATYSFTDKTYAQLVERLNGQPVSEALRQDILLYFADLDLPYATKKNHKEWKKVVSYLNTLRSTHATCSPASTARNWSFPK
jgi:hypothetical protein